MVRWQLLWLLLVAGPVLATDDEGKRDTSGADSQQPSQSDHQPRRDRQGDPLPPQAQARLGTVRWRHAGPVDFVAFSPDGRTVVSVSADDHTIRLWEAATGRERRRLKGYRTPTPDGLVGPLSLARCGVPVLLLEMHQDFDRDFRGDTIHPSVLQILDEIGLAERLLQLPHGKQRGARVPNRGRAGAPERCRRRAASAFTTPSRTPSPPPTGRRSRYARGK